MCASFVLLYCPQIDNYKQITHWEVTCKCLENLLKKAEKHIFLKLAIFINGSVLKGVWGLPFVWIMQDWRQVCWNRGAIKKIKNKYWFVQQPTMPDCLKYCVPISDHCLYILYYILHSKNAGLNTTQCWVKIGLNTCWVVFNQQLG